MEDNLLDSEFRSESDKSSLARFTDTDRNNLSLVAYWSKFLGIVGFVFLGFIVLIIIAMVVGFSAFGGLGGMNGSEGIYAGTFGIVMLLVYVPFLFLFFYISRAAYRLGVNLKHALANNDESSLSSSFDNLRAIFRTQGIMTAVVVVIYGVILLFGILGGGFALLSGL